MDHVSLLVDLSWQPMIWDFCQPHHYAVVHYKTIGHHLAIVPKNVLYS